LLDRVEQSRAVIDVVIPVSTEDRLSSARGQPSTRSLTIATRQRAQ
jgi:hypothetical protein